MMKEDVVVVMNIILELQDSLKRCVKICDDEEDSPSLIPGSRMRKVEDEDEDYFENIREIQNKSCSRFIRENCAQLVETSIVKSLKHGLNKCNHDAT
ncbi:unnamed protein product [Vicia faba]|uniref:Uncharacterized protein n=1 Tax=Vicia faba TaxID=3906 RepID=A0AAV1APD0_VICFA|nr:unnamed protein product [Vicia faba]